MTAKVILLLFVLACVYPSEGLDDCESRCTRLPDDCRKLCKMRNYLLYEDDGIKDETNGNVVTCVNCTGFQDSGCNIPYSMKKSPRVTCEHLCEIAVLQPNTTHTVPRDRIVIRGCPKYDMQAPPPLGYVVSDFKLCEGNMCNADDRYLVKPDEYFNVPTLSPPDTDFFYGRGVGDASRRQGTGILVLYLLTLASHYLM